MKKSIHIYGDMKLFSFRGGILLFCIFHVLLALIGGVVNYSPTPFWDMLNGYLGFYVNSGDWSAWWGQHNEHRIFLSRILFWIDIRLFDGSMIFLLAINYILMALAGVLFIKIATVKYEGNKNLLFFLVVTIICLLFSWLQNENIVWGFQSQFFLAQILPLLSFYLLYRSAKLNSLQYYIAACVTGFLCSLTMANGISALPIMVVVAYFLGLSFARIVWLALLSIITIFIYFLDYVPPAHHGSLSDALLNHPLKVLQYVLLYLGSPIYHLAGKSLYFIAQLAGTFLIFSSTYFFLTSVKKRNNPNIDWVILGFLIYIGASAIATGGSRVIFGVDQALSGRYLTPVLMGWVGLTILFSNQITVFYGKHPNKFLLFISALLIALTPFQLKALNGNDSEAFYRMQSALALELSVKDEKAINHIFPSMDWAIDIAKEFRDRDLSVFSHPLIKDINQTIGSVNTLNPADLCQGYLDEVIAIKNENIYVRLRGWAFDAISEHSPRRAFVVDNNQKIVGYVIFGAPREDVAKAVNIKAAHSGFEGYVTSESYGGNLKIVSEDCMLPISMPKLAYSVSSSQLNGEVDILTEHNVIDSNEWKGSDFYKSEHDGLRIYGSYISGDRDTGTIKISAKNGDKFFYRSGPSSVGQKISVDGVVNNLPTSLDWTLLEIHSNEGDSLIDIIDEGSDWGQWSAIAVKSKD